MNIANRNLTLVEDTATGMVNCIAGCRVDLNVGETASLAVPFNQGFRLRCHLIGDDPEEDDLLFTYPKSKKFDNLLEILNVNQVFEADISSDMLNEDPNSIDEIQARFTLINLSTGESVVKRSNKVVREFA